MALHHTEEEQKRFRELMSRFENEKEAIKNGFFKGFTREEVIFMGKMNVVEFGEKYPQLCEYYMTELDLDYQQLMLGAMIGDIAGSKYEFNISYLPDDMKEVLIRIISDITNEGYTSEGLAKLYDYAEQSST